MLDNIIGNVCKYFNKGELVDVMIEFFYDNVVICVWDYGLGVNKDEIEKLL